MSGKTDNGSRQARGLGRALVIPFALALAALGALLVASLVLERSLGERDGEALAAMRSAARQQATASRIAREALLAGFNAGDAARSQHAESIRRLADHLDDATRIADGAGNAEAWSRRGALVEASARFADAVDQGRGLDPEARDPMLWVALHSLLEAEQEFRAEMEGLLAAAQHNAAAGDGHARALLILRWMVLLALAALAAQGLLVVRPALRRLREQAREQESLRGDLLRTVQRLEDERAQNERLAMVASKTTNSVVITGPDGLVEWVNEGFTRLTGYALEEARGRKPGHLLQGPETDPAVVARMRDAIAARQPFRVEILNYSKDKRPYWVLVQAEPVFDEEGRHTHFIAIQTDITEARRQEEELRSARDAAEAGLRARTEFLANMSHEIRTPLHAITGLAAILADTPMDKAQKGHLAALRASADSLLAIVNDILDFSRIEAGGLVLEQIPFELPVLLDEVLDLLAPMAAEKGLWLAAFAHADAGRRFLGDPLRLRQVLVNLAGNAVKFTAEGEVAIEATVAAGGPGNARQSLRFEVRDTGIGIPPERIGRLFQSFSQVDSSTTRRFGGTGLGLAISKQLVELMDGRIGVDSAEGRGSRFWFEVPLVRLASGPESLDEVLAGLAGRRVLHASGCPTCRRQAVEALAPLAVAVASAADADGALAAARAPGDAPFDAIILDDRLPGPPVVEVARTLRAEGIAPGAPLVLVAAATPSTPSPDAASRLFAATAHKPLRHNSLADALAEALLGPVSAKQRACDASSAFADPLPQARILLAEDNPVNRQVAEHLLRREGLACDIASDGLEALEAHDGGRYDLILMDCQMPRMDGYEAARRIRAIERQRGRPPVPIIAMTAAALPNDRARCLEAGMDDHIAKPIDAAVFRDVLRRHLDPVAASPISTGRYSGGAAPRARRTLDRGRLLEAAGTPPAAALLLEVLLSDLDQKTTKLQAAFEAGDSDDIARLAHGLKGAALNVGAERLARAAMKLEMAAEVRDESLARRHFATLREEGDALRCAAASWQQEVRA